MTDPVESLARTVATDAHTGQVEQREEQQMKDSPRHDYIVVTAHCTISDTDYAWDGTRWPNLDSAISHGFTLDRCDDFNIGLVHGDRLVWFGWMDKPLNQDRDKVADALGFTVKARLAT